MQKIPLVRNKTSLLTNAYNIFKLAAIKFALLKLARLMLAVLFSSHYNFYDKNPIHF